MTDINSCYHCGADCGTNPIQVEDKLFCCDGCKIAFEILNNKDLCQYYNLEQSPGNTPAEAGFQHRFAYLDDEDIQQSLIDYKDAEISKLTVRIPGMHCTSCIWILERLFRIRPEIANSSVDFLRKECSITFHYKQISLREVIELLVSIGYEPQINLKDISETITPSFNRSMVIKLGVAAFAFGNIMLLSFPEYFGLGRDVDGLQPFFRFLNILLALPVLLYSSTDYFKSAITGLKKRFINIDIPIAIGILALFFRSTYEILSGIGPGFMDSFTGLVFLLLIGKVFQQKTFDALSFERDYRSYFPLAVMKSTPEGERSIPLSKLVTGDRIIIRNGELIPADAILLKSKALIDYSFVTGESKNTLIQPGETIYAGGRLSGTSVEMEITHDVSQSYLTQLWNQDLSNTTEKSITSILDQVSKYFTIGVLSIAAISGISWAFIDPMKMVHVITSILIVACPCALALSAPFTLGNTIRIFGHNKFFLKNSNVIEKLSKITHIVFDKTGTITHSGKTSVHFSPVKESYDINDYKNDISSIAKNSSHPLSRLIVSHLGVEESSPVIDYNEISGKGLSGFVGGNYYLIGSAEFCEIRHQEDTQTNVHIVQNGKWLGTFTFTNHYREHLTNVVQSLRKRYSLSVLTGDNDSEQNSLKNIFGKDTSLRFYQSPYDKRDYIEALQKKGETVAMIGDGLNDAGALKTSDIGISISEDVYLFSPACDAILETGSFQGLNQFLSFSTKAMNIITWSIVISLLYNIIGLSFAIQGLLSPIVSAILMPISSISVIAFSTGMVRLLYRQNIQ